MHNRQGAQNEILIKVHFLTLTHPEGHEEKRKRERFTTVKSQARGKHEKSNEDEKVQGGGRQNILCKCEAGVYPKCNTMSDQE